MPEPKGNGWDEIECPGCHLPARDWPHLKTEGFITKEGEYYCCQDCSQGHICECGGATKEGKVSPHELKKRP